MITSPFPMPSLALLAGGIATRLRPITNTIPKVMVQVAGEPFISHQLKLLKREGISEVVICAGYLGKHIQNFVQGGKDFGINVYYSYDGEQFLGTGGALRKALPLLGKIFWVMYGDSFLDISFRPILDYFLAHKKLGLMTVLKNNNRWDKSNVIFENKLVCKYDKKKPSSNMEYIDYGLGLLSKTTINQRPSGMVFDLAQVYMDLVEHRELLGYEVHQRFYEIGSFKGLEETQNYFEQGRQKK